MKRALITGGAGFLGLHLARRLLADGVQVDLVDDFSRGRHDAELGAIAADPRASLIDLDLARPGALVAAMPRDVDVVFHLAARLGVERVLNDPFGTLVANFSTTVQALEAARTLPALAGFVFFSSSEVYAGTLAAGEGTIPTPEAVPLVLPPLAHPRTSYPLSKLCGEALTAAAGLPATIVRPHNVYGPRMGGDHVIPQLLSRIAATAEGAELVVFSPRHTRAFCYVDDAIEQVVRAIANPAAQGETLHVGNPEPELTMLELAERLLAITGRRLELREGPDSPGSPLRRCPDITRIIALTRAQPRVGLDEGLMRTWAWIQENPLESS